MQQACLVCRRGNGRPPICITHYEGKVLVTDLGNLAGKVVK